NLRNHGGGWSFTEEGSGIGDAQFVDDRLIRSKIAAVGTEGLGERTHQNVNIVGIDAKVIANATPAGADRADRVSFIYEKVKSIFFPKLDEGGKIAHGSFHRIKALDDNEDLFPRPVSAGLALRDDVPEKAFEVLHVIVLEHFDHSSGQPG